MHSTIKLIFPAPTMNHFNVVNRVLRYLKSCPGRRILLSRDSQVKLQGYSDVDWAGCSDTRRWISGQCFFFGRSLIFLWIEKKLIVSRSSSEVEYRAFTTATCELQWLLYLFEDLKIESIQTPVLYCDNHSVLYIAANLVFHKRTKHLEIDCHIFWEKMLAWVMKLFPCSSKDQLIDFFTKSLLPQPFNSLVSKLMINDIYQPSTLGRCYKMKLLQM